MKFFTTKSRAHGVDARTAVLQGLPDDGGLFVPEKLPQFTAAELDGLRQKSFTEISFAILAPFFNDVPENELQKIISGAFDFPVPLKEIDKGIRALELFHGPTLAFKDFGARFLARLMSYYRRGEKRDLTILVATSGDTGSAVASGFFEMPGMKVVLLYPSGKVSRTQEMQLTTLGGNVTALEITGTFDDCQALVKEAFLDPEIKNARELTSANSINIGRLLPQACYYFSAWSQLPETRGEIVVSVPSGNLGNVAAGVTAKKMGLPVTRFVAALNQNSVLADYLESGKFSPRASVPTLSNAMDVGNPSNIHRLIELAGGSIAELRRFLAAESFTDSETLNEIREVFAAHSYLLDPHGAVGLLGLRRAIAGKKDVEGIFLETAHPAKFGEIVEKATGKKVELPPALRECLAKKKVSVVLPAEFGKLKEFLLQ